MPKEKRLSQSIESFNRTYLLVVIENHNHHYRFYCYSIHYIRSIIGEKKENFFFNKHYWKAIKKRETKK